MENMEICTNIKSIANIGTNKYIVITTIFAFIL